MTNTGDLLVHHFRAMASPIEVQVKLPEAPARRLFEEIEAEFAASESTLSRFQDTSELTLLNRNLGRLVPVSKRLYEAVSLSYRAYRTTHGVFDPRVIKVLDDLGYRGAPLVIPGSAPADAGPEAAHPDLRRPFAPVPNPHTQSPWLCRKPRDQSVQLTAPIDLGGLGKGLTVRRASRLAGRIAGSFLVNAGGDLYVAGPGPVDGKWSLGIENPFEPNSLAAAIAIPGGHALCTSSIKNRHWQHENQHVHHLIQPFTGQPGGEGLKAVTVLGRDAMWSEVFTKYLFLMGSRHVASMAKALQLVAWWIYSDGTLGMTGRAVSSVTWMNQGLGIREVV